MRTLWPMRDRFRTDGLCREQKDSKQIICAENKKIQNILFVNQIKKIKKIQNRLFVKRTNKKIQNRLSVKRIKTMEFHGCENQSPALY